VNGNVNISSAGNANIVTVTGTGANITGTLSASGNANVGNLGTTTAVITTGNITTINSGLLQNGNSNVSITANANVAIAVTGANRLIVTSTGANLTGTLNISGDTTFSGTGQRILGDFSNATLASRTVFQSSTANTATDIPVLPNGTAAGGSSLNTFNLSNIANSAYIVMGANSTVTRLYSATTGTATLLPLAFGMGSSEAARIDTSSIFYVGSAGSFYNAGLNAKGYFYSSGEGKALSVATNASAVGYTALAVARQSSDGQVIECWRGASVVGSVSVGASSTAFNTSSDYRLKDNPQPLTGSGAFIDALQPKTWTWKINGEIGTGFIAHEVAEVAPSSVFGEKDAVNEDGTPRHQAMEYGSAEFIANMIAELQELRRSVAQLEAAANPNP
jgi:hypothetical protein